MANFWDTLPKPFLALAPMEDVTDSVFRQVICSVGKPDVCFTEFVNVDGIVGVYGSGFEKFLFGSTPPAVPSKNFSGIPAPVKKEDMKKNGLLQRLYFTEAERPLVAQIWGSKPENFRKAAQVVKELGFDGIDINMGCPQRIVMKTGGCGALIGEYDLVKEIILATKEGAEELPVSVKTRIGKKKIMTEEWIGFLLEQNLAAITIHGRTVAEQSKVPAHWDEIGKVVALRDSLANTENPSSTAWSLPASGCGRFSTCGLTLPLIIGNGDVGDAQEAREKVQQYGVDGVMIARGVFQKPTAFVKYDLGITNHDRIQLFRTHIELYRDTWEGKKSFFILRKFVKMYINGWEGAKELREKLMGAENYTELLEMLH